jgi:FMN phosphatase YigB (HAD superfamily)
MIKAVIFDIDGTLADCQHRRHFVEKAPKDWEAFYAGMIHDKPKPNVVALTRMLSAFMPILLVTGRPEKWLQHTIAWLEEHGVLYEALFMRKDGDFRSDVDLKAEIYCESIAPCWNISLVVDDRTSVVKMWRELGLECWQVAEGDF